MSTFRRTYVAVSLLGIIAGPLAPDSAGAQGIAPASGKAMCSALTPADFTKAGVPVSALSAANLYGNESAYCVYQSAAGKVEFDLFFPAGASPKEVLATERTVLGEVGGRYEPVSVAGADGAQFAMSLPDLKGSSSIVVRKGTAVLTIVIPQGAKARQQLITLAHWLYLRR